MIEVKGVSKRYQLGAIGASSLREDLRLWWRRLQGQDAKTIPQEFWALKDVSFNVQPGEVVGIIGRNGAGKSTLLKVLSKITEPSTGEILVRGRIASLLEVGTGFHPDLSGRQNIYLNGAILGMRKQEIARNFDEIVAFSGVEKFIDTPVKRYSSGMYVRLAFAIAAHLEPEILIIDEVLAVGDAEFQKKCLGKMQDVSSHGRTVLFVSHNMGMINSLCQTSILLEGGKVAAIGPATQVALQYFGGAQAAPHEVNFSSRSKPPGDDLACLLHARVCNSSGESVYEVDIRSSFKVAMRYKLLQMVPTPPFPNFHFFDARGECVFVSSSTNYVTAGTEPGTFEAECIVPGHLLNDGVYFVGVALTFTHQSVHVSFYERDALSFVIRDPIDETLNAGRSGYSGPMPGVVRPQLDWTIQQVA